MDDPRKLIDSFQTTYWLMGKFAEGLTHADSIAQPPFKSNSFNWVLGHILVSRDRVLGLLNLESVLKDFELDLYETGSDPIAGETAVSLEKLLLALDASQAKIVEGLTTAPPELLAETADEQRNQSIADKIAGLHWHETYHVGQLEILRQVSSEREAFP